MVILADTREQNVLSFKHKYVEGVERRKLDIGDYGVQFKDSHIPSVFFERKSISDLYGTMGKGYVRFKKEMQRAFDSKSTLIIIVEGTLSDVKRGYKHSTIKGSSIVDKLFTLETRHGVRTVYCKNRREMSEYIIRQFIGLGKEYIRRKK